MASLLRRARFVDVKYESVGEGSENCSPFKGNTGYGAALLKLLNVILYKRRGTDFDEKRY